MASNARIEGDSETPTPGGEGIGLAADGLLAGKYRLDHLIARGGMGTVWQATHVVLGRPVAVKFVDFGVTSDDRVVQRFLREAKTAALIHHPNVVDIVDFGTTTDGKPFMVMELLDGETLLSRIARTPGLTTREALLVFSQLMLGLEAVHRAGVVHRDLKPANVFLSIDAPDDDPFARLLDFGISYSVDPESELRRGRFGTNASLIVGTPEYMSPEQAEGRPDVDARTDLYSAAVILYEMLAGALPFQAEYPGAVLFKVIEGGHVPLVRLRPDLADVSEVIERTMSRDRAVRPQNASELRRAVLSAVRGGSDLSGLHARLDAASDPPSRPSNPRLFIPPPPRLPADAPPVLEQVAPEPSPAARPRTSERVAAGVVLLLVLLVVAFWLGISYASAPTPPAPSAMQLRAAPASAPAAPLTSTPAPAVAPAPPVAAAPALAPAPATARPTAPQAATPQPGARPRPRRRAPGEVLRQLDF